MRGFDRPKPACGCFLLSELQTQSGYISALGSFLGLGISSRFAGSVPPTLSNNRSLAVMSLSTIRRSRIVKVAPATNDHITPVLGSLYSSFSVTLGWTDHQLKAL